MALQHKIALQRKVTMYEVTDSLEVLSQNIQILNRSKNLKGKERNK